MKKDEELLSLWREIFISNILNIIMSEFEEFVKSKDRVLKGQIEDSKNNGWKVFSNRFVAFLDIAGFKATTKYPFYTYCLMQAFKRIALKEQERFIEDDIDRLYIVAVSDSIVIFTKDDSVESFCCFAHVVGKIFNKSLLFKRFLNAAMACGQTFVDIEQQLFGGDAYNKAYTLQDSMDYYGILCDPSIAEYLANNKDCKNEYYDFYQKRFLDVEYYIKCKNCDKPFITGKRLNYFWYDDVLYSDILYTCVIWGDKEIKLCTNDPNGMIAGNYEDFITNTIENYGEDDSKVKNKINHTMDV